MKEIIMPKFGFTDTEAEIVQWLKHEGDAIEKGEPICEVTTDKVNMEVEAPESGTLAGLRYKAGDVVPVTQVIAVVIEPGETLTAAASPKAADAPKTTSTPAPSTAPALANTVPNATPVAMRVAQERGIDIGHITGTGPGGRITREDVLAFKAPPALVESAIASAGEGRVRATPNARRMAEESHIDLLAIKGSGPNGRVQGEDVVSQVRSSAPKPIVETPPLHPVTPSPQQPAPTASLPYTGMRKTIGTRLQQSYQQAPHVTFSVDVDVSNAESLRARANAKLKDGQVRISLTAILVKACAWALLRQPSMNARLDLDAGKIVLNDAAHIGIAVALDNGLIVPVIRDVQAKGLLHIARDMADVTARAKANKLTPADVGNGTFTLSNLGMFGIDRFTAIINPPETAILAVGRASRKFVPDANDQPVVRPIMSLTLSADHRVIDGAIAARFMSDLRDAVEQPDSILI